MKSFAFVALLGLGAASAGSLRRCLRFNVPAFSSNLLLRPVVLAARVLFLVSTTPSLAVQAPDVETQALLSTDCPNVDSTAGRQHRLLDGSR